MLETCPCANRKQEETCFVFSTRSYFIVCASGKSQLNPVFLFFVSITLSIFHRDVSGVVCSSAMLLQCPAAIFPANR